MGIVLKQSFVNTIILFLGFFIGGVNVLFLYTHFLQEDYFGLITFLLSTANIIMPFLVFGMQNTVIKFYSSYKSDAKKESFLTATLLIPLVIIIPFALISTYFYDSISNWISKENPMIKSYSNLIFIVAFFMGYFEIFYAWTKVKFNSVFGNFIKEIFARICTSILLVAVYYKWLTNEQFIYAVVVVYGLRTVIMKLYVFYKYRPKFRFEIPENSSEIFKYSLYIIVAGSAAGILLEIDKFMIPQLEQIAEVAYYSVGIYIASVIAIPTRAMQQITSPLTAKLMNESSIKETGKLYQQTSLNLLIAGGLLFLIINLNIENVYEIIDKPQFTKGIWVVLIISIAKLIELALGIGNAILINSNYYKVFFYIAIAMAISVIVLNEWLIRVIGINGAALATLIVVFIFSLIKIIYINSKLKIQPFQVNSFKILMIILIMFLGFNLWNFNLNPILNILLKSTFILVFYVILIKLAKVSKDFDNMIVTYLGQRRNN